MGIPVCCRRPKRSTKTNKSFTKDALNAYKENKTVNGVKIPTWLHFFLVLTYLTELLLTIYAWDWLRSNEIVNEIMDSKSLIKQTFSILYRISQVDERLEEIKLKIEISRTPRSYSKYGSNWKAFEFRNFILYFGIPILADILLSIQLETFFTAKPRYIYLT